VKRAKRLLGAGQRAVDGGASTYRFERHARQPAVQHILELRAFFVAAGRQEGATKRRRRSPPATSSMACGWSPNTAKKASAISPPPCSLVLAASELALVAKILTTWSTNWIPSLICCSPGVFHIAGGNMDGFWRLMLALTSSSGRPRRGLDTCSTAAPRSSGGR
jgi:hypothetical protein